MRLKPFRPSDHRYKCLMQGKLYQRIALLLGLMSLIFASTVFIEAVGQAGVMDCTVAALFLLSFEEIYFYSRTRNYYAGFPPGIYALTLATFFAGTLGWMNIYGVWWSSVTSLNMMGLIIAIGAWCAWFSWGQYSVKERSAPLAQVQGLTSRKRLIQLQRQFAKHKHQAQCSMGTIIIISGISAYFFGVLTTGLVIFGAVFLAFVVIENTGFLFFNRYAIKRVRISTVIQLLCLPIIERLCFIGGAAFFGILKLT